MNERLYSSQHQHLFRCLRPLPNYSSRTPCTIPPGWPRKTPKRVVRAQSRTGPPAAPAPEVPAFARPQPMTAALPAAPAPAVQPVQPAAAQAPARAPWLRGAQTGTGRSPVRAAVAAAAAPSASAVPPEGLP